MSLITVLERLSRVTTNYKQSCYSDYKSIVVAIADGDEPNAECLRDILLAKFAGLAAASTAAVAIFGAAAAGSSVIFGTGPTVSAVTATCVHLLLLATAFGALALSLGAATGQPNVAAGVAGVVAAISYVTNAMLPLAGLDGWARLSPWYYYAGSDPLLNGLNVGHLVVLAVLILGAVAAALYSFERRDLKG